MLCRPITSKQSLASLKEIDFCFVFVVGFLVGGVGDFCFVFVVGLLVGGVGDGPLPPGCIAGVASQVVSVVDFLAAVIFNPSNIRPATSFCFASAVVHSTCL